MNITKLYPSRIVCGAFAAAVLLTLPLPARGQQAGDPCVSPACPDIPDDPGIPRLVINPKVVSASVDFGQVVKGQTQGSSEVDRQPLTRTGVYLTASGVYDDRLEIRLTTGGLFWYVIPEYTSAARLVRFGPGVGQAQAIYSFGDPANPAAKLQFGLFPHKYNSDASNLGEYLYRSGTYPGFLWTGGWSYMNAASYLAQGARFILPTMGGMVTHEFTAYMERGIQPLHDISPGYLVTARPASFLEIGAGVVWAHAISLAPKRLSPKNENNAYSKTTNMPVKGAAAYGTIQVDLPVGHPDNPNPFPITVIVDTTAREKQTLQDWEACENGGDCSNIGYYTFKGFKSMARASVDLGVLTGQAMFRPGEFKLYGEVAILGVEEQPFYYDKLSERMPIMFGMNIPTFGMLDRLAVEGEYLRTRFVNTVGLTFDRQVPVPLNDEVQDSPYDHLEAKTYWKWSTYARRKITDGVTIHAQAASDHLRHYGSEVKPTSKSLTVSPKEWYYVVRLDFGLF
jgi:hypothetical protein